MDVLLKELVKPLANERQAMFAMIDRFMESVGQYLTEYDTLWRRRNADLEKRRADGGKTLQNLKSRHEQELNALRTENAQRDERIQRRAEQAKRDADNQILQASRQSDSQQKEERDRWRQHDANEEALLRKCRAYLNGVEELYRSTDQMLGETFRKKNKLALICADVEEANDIQSMQEALAVLSDEMTEKTQALFRDIEKIHNSLPRTILFFRKRNACCQELHFCRTQIMKAYAFVERECRMKQQRQSVETENRCMQIRQKFALARDTILQDYENRKQGFAKELQQSQAQGQRNLASLETRQKQSTLQQKTEVDRQFNHAIQEWDRRLETCNGEFLARMETDFPSDRMGAWMKQFWSHPSKVEDYPAYEHAQMNVLIGEARVDVSQWFGGETKEVMRKLAAERYPFLFMKTALRLPYSLSVEDGTSVLLSHADQEESRARMCMNSLGMRLLCSVPACQMRFRLMDAYGTGAFNRLTALDPATRNVPDEPTVKSIVLNDKVTKDPEEMRRQIREAKSQMESLSSGMASYSSLREFNEKNTLSRRAYQPLMMMNFPLELTVDAIRNLTAMAEQCSKWGYSMFLAAPDKYLGKMKPEIRTEAQSMLKSVLYMRLEEKAVKVRNSSFKSESAASILLYALPADSNMEAVTQKIRVESVKASRILIEFSKAKDICPEQSEWFSQHSNAGIIIPVGYLDTGLPFRMAFDDGHVHAVVAGNTGSGKTNLLHVLMTNVMLRYTPAEVEIYLVDFKHGLDFRVYTNFNLPNFRAISINDDPEFALAMLEHLDREIERRAALLNTLPVADYNRRNPERKLSRILLIIDELYVLMEEASQETREAIIKKLSDFAHRARAFGLHLLVCGQDLCEIENFTGKIANQCKTRIALFCGDKEAESLFMNEEGKNLMHSLDATDKGACVFSLSDGHNPQIEHTAYLNPEEHERLLRQIGEYYSSRKQYTRAKVLLTDVANDRNNAFQRFVSSGSLIPLPGLFLVGEPMSMELKLPLTPRGNLWIAGGGSVLEAERAGNSAMFFCFLSLILRKLREGASFPFNVLCTDCVKQMPFGSSAVDSNRFGQLLENFPDFADNDLGSSLQKTIELLNDQLEQRMSGQDMSQPDGQSPGDATSWTPLLWILSRPETVRDLSDEDIMRLGSILYNGPRYKIQTVVWTGYLKPAVETLRLKPEMFHDKLCLEMPPDSLKSVLGEEPVKKPNGYKAIYSGASMVLTRIYDLPKGNWMETLFGRLKATDSGSNAHAGV